MSLGPFLPGTRTTPRPARRLTELTAAIDAPRIITYWSFRKGFSRIIVNCGYRRTFNASLGYVSAASVTRRKTAELWRGAICSTLRRDRGSTTIKTRGGATFQAPSRSRVSTLRQIIFWLGKLHLRDEDATCVFPRRLRRRRGLATFAPPGRLKSGRSFNEGGRIKGTWPPRASRGTYTHLETF